MLTAMANYQKWLVLMQVIVYTNSIFRCKYQHFTLMILKSIVYVSFNYWQFIEESLGFSKMGLAFSWIAILIFCEHSKFWLIFTKQNVQIIHLKNVDTCKNWHHRGEMLMFTAKNARENYVPNCTFEATFGPIFIKPKCVWDVDIFLSSKLFTIC